MCKKLISEIDVGHLVRKKYDFSKTSNKFRQDY